jgi:predicted amidophosphoribosyltransferase
MGYKCQKCDSPILVLRLGYCSNCREPISSEILPDAKKQALAQSEREYEEMRDRIRQEKDRQRGGSSSIDIGDIGGGRD